MDQNTPLAGSRRELTKERFEQLGALHCEPGEIAGYTGTTEEKLEKWCRKTYKRSLGDMLDMTRQDGRIAIRQAAFDLMQKSAPMVAQQFARYLNDPDEDDGKAAAAVRRVFDALDPGREGTAALFGTAESGAAPAGKSDEL